MVLIGKELWKLSIKTVIIMLATREFRGAPVVQRRGSMFRHAGLGDDRASRRRIGLQRRKSRPSLEPLETRQLLSTYCGDQLQRFRRAARQAIQNANADVETADVAGRHRFRYPGLDGWLISMSRFPALIRPRKTGRSRCKVLCRRSPTRCRLTVTPRLLSACRISYPNAISSAVQSVAVTGSPTGRNLHPDDRRAADRRQRCTIPYDATAATVQARSGAIVGINNIDRHGRPRAGHLVHDHISER